MHTNKDGQQIANKILALPKENRPDAIFTSSDEVASGILQMMIKAGKKIPEDLAIMGFDNQPFTALLTVPLTTIAQPVATLGKESTNLLIALLEDRNYQIDDSELNLELIIRESV